MLECCRRVEIRSSPAICWLGPMNFSAVSNKTWIGRLLRAPLQMIPSGTRMPILQGRLVGKKWIVGSSNHGCWLGSYEYDKQRAFASAVKWGSTVFDVGAHVGFYTLLASELVGPEGRVFAFEPLPSNVVLLREHLRINHTRNATVIEAAVGDHSGVVGFKRGSSTAMGYVSSTGDLEVESVALDELISKQELPVPQYVKIDVEGGEVLVLQGSLGLLKQEHPMLFLATHGPDLHRQCCGLLGSLGYAIRALGFESLECADEIIATF